MLTLLKAGAFHVTEGASIEPMSPYKWRRLTEVSKQFGILDYVLAAPQTLGTDIPQLDIPEASEATGETPVAETPNDSDDLLLLFNFLTNRHITEVKEEEMNSPQTDEETLLILDSIISNAHSMITKDISIEGIVRLGRLVREKWKVVDWDKLLSWLSYIGLVQTANFFANILIQVMEFSPDELAFYVKPYRGASSCFLRALALPPGKHKTSLRVKYDVAMLETLSCKVSHALSYIKDIEE